MMKRMLRTESSAVHSWRRSDEYCFWRRCVADFALVKLTWRLQKATAQFAFAVRARAQQREIAQVFRGAALAQLLLN
jgi:hypothetical protein